MKKIVLSGPGGEAIMIFFANLVGDNALFQFPTPIALLSEISIQEVKTCRVCGCTDGHACIRSDGPCYWVEEDLCSACVVKEAKSIIDKRRASKQ